MATGGGTPEIVFITTASDGGWDVRDSDLTKYFNSYVSDSSFSLATIERPNQTTLRITPHQNATIAYALNISTSRTVA